MRVVKRYIPKQGNNPQIAIIPDKIVIHYSGVPGVSARRLAECLYNNNANNVSANYCVDDVEIIETIPPGYMSYGVTGENNHIINIECCYKKSTGEFEPATIELLRQIVRYLMNRFNLSADNVIRHFDLSHFGKHCPAFYISSDRWNKLHKTITGGQYGVQIGAFAEKNNAINFARGAKRNKYLPSIIKNGDVYCVFVGVFVDEKLARNFLKNVHRKYPWAYIRRI